MPSMATDNQKRAIKLLSRKYPDTVLPLLAERGGVVENLTYSQGHEIMDVVGQKHPYKKGERKQRNFQDEREQQERQREREQQEQDEHDQMQMQDNEQHEQDEQDDQQEQEQKDRQEDQKKMQKVGFRPGSKQEFIANALKENNLDVDATRRAIADRVGQIPQLTFTENVEGRGRVPLPLGSLDDDSQQSTQHGRAIKTIYAVRRQLMLGGEGGFKQKQEREEKQEEQREHKQEDKREEKREERHNRTAVELLAWIRQVRKYCQDKAADGKPLDTIGLRPVESGASMLSSDIPLIAIKHALTMHFPPEARRALGVRDYDATTFKPEQRKDGIHAALPYCLTIVNSRDFDGMRLLLTLIGDKGTGKTTLAKQIADEMQLPFGMVSMTSGTSPSAFNGRPMVADDGTQALIMALTNMSRIEEDPGKAMEFAKQAVDMAKVRHSKGDTVMSQFVKIYGGGGVFLFDELDAADENLLLGTNAALANGKFANPATGKIVEQHPDFIAVAGMNTMGLGSGRDYNARNRLDAATLDRWNPGRVKIELDPRIEESMFWSIINRGQ